TLAFVEAAYHQALDRCRQLAQGSYKGIPALVVAGATEKGQANLSRLRSGSVAHGQGAEVGVPDNAFRRESGMGKALGRCLTGCHDPCNPVLVLLDPRDTLQKVMGRQGTRGHAVPAQGLQVAGPAGCARAFAARVLVVEICSGADGAEVMAVH